MYKTNKRNQQKDGEKEDGSETSRPRNDTAISSLGFLSFFFLNMEEMRVHDWVSCVCVCVTALGLCCCAGFPLAAVSRG